MEHGATGVTEQSSKGREGGSARKREGTDRQSMGWEAVRGGGGPDPTKSRPGLAMSLSCAGHEPELCRRAGPEGRSDGAFMGEARSAERL